MLEEGKVFPGGIPGIGKSELAKEYAKRHKNEYTDIVCIAAQKDLRRTIAAMDLADDVDGGAEGSRFRRYERFLRTLREDTLLIVDNYNIPPAEDEYLDELLRYGCRVPITPRCNYAVLLAETGQMQEGYMVLQLLLELTERNISADCMDCADIHRAITKQRGSMHRARSRL